MHTNWKTLLSMAAIVAALAGGSTLYAYADTPSQQSGGMMQGGQGGMMNMMQQMGQMMETCNNMMAQHHEPETTKEGKTHE